MERNRPGTTSGPSTASSFSACANLTTPAAWTLTRTASPATSSSGSRSSSRAGAKFDGLTGVEYPGSGEVRPAAKKKMNIDERLEALTQSLELLASLHKDDEQRNEKMRRGMEETRRGMEEMRRGMEETRRGMEEMRRGMEEMH